MQETLSFPRRQEILNGIQKVVKKSWQEVLQCQSEVCQDLKTALYNVLNKAQIQEKSPGDIVTSLDFEINNFLIQSFLECFDFNILSEEHIKSGSNKINRGSKFTLIIDPIDGTTNLVAGFPFSTAISLIDSKGKPLIGFVYDPINNETFTSIGDGKSYLNSSEIHVSKQGLGKMLIIVSDGSSDQEKKTLLIDEVMLNAKYFRIYGSAQLDLCKIARGSGEGYLKTRAPNWDILAGAFIIQNAGGVYELTENNDIIASNGIKEVHNRLRYIMRQVNSKNKSGWIFLPYARGKRFISEVFL